MTSPEEIKHDFAMLSKDGFVTCLGHAPEIIWILGKISLFTFCEISWSFTYMLIPKQRRSNQIYR